MKPRHSSSPKKRLPWLDRTVNRSPHVVILGAGASIASHIDSGRKGPELPSMRTLIDVLDLHGPLSAAGFSKATRNFEAFYGDLVASGKNAELVTLIENRTRDYFSSLVLPDTPTIYDYLLAGLRKKDIIATFNWDPLLMQAYRRAGDKNHLPRITFLHGNVEVAVCYRDNIASVRGAVCTKCGKRFSPLKLLFPVQQKDYQTDPFTKGEWDVLRHFLEDAYFLTIFGYSAPATDVEAKKLMLEVWKKNPTRNLAEFEVIDVAPEKKLERSWKPFFVSHHYTIWKSFFESQVATHPRRSCDAFAAASLMAEPWEDNPFPRFKSVDELWEWVVPLIAEEDRYETEKVPYNGKPLKGADLNHEK